VAGGPSFVFPETVARYQDAPLPIIVSDAAGLAAARRLTRPDNWEPGEWDQLTRGETGQWAMAIRNHEPVSICHTPAASTNGAEAGVWTRPDHRGAGLAPAVTASWQRLERTRHRTLFYSTDRNNLASRAVARKLALLPLGWLWTVR
jgi:RimJ/RimL family protein N-acetyltransferase